MSTVVDRYKSAFFPYLVKQLEKYFNHPSEHIKFCFLVKNDDGLTYLRVSMVFTNDDILIPFYFLEELKSDFVISKQHFSKKYSKKVFKQKFDMVSRKFLISDFLTETENG